MQYEPCPDYSYYCGRQFRKCAGPIEDAAGAIKYLERVRIMIPEDAVHAPGRVRDQFEFLMPGVDIALRGNEERETEIREIVQSTLAQVDQVREEMFEKGTKYVPHNLPLVLNEAVDKIEAKIMGYALDDLESCVCQPRTDTDQPPPTS